MPACGDLPVRDFSGGKDAEHAAVLDPCQGLFQSAAIALDCSGAVQRVDKDAVLIEFGNVFEQEVGEHLHVGTHAGEQHCQHCAIEHAVGMIGDGDYRAFAWNALDVGIVDAQVDVHLAQESFENGAIARASSRRADRVRALDRAEQTCSAKPGSPAKTGALASTRLRVTDRPQDGGLACCQYGQWCLRGDEGQVKCW